MRVAWRCNPYPACFVTVAAETAEAAILVAERRFGITDLALRKLMGPPARVPQDDETAAKCTVDTVLRIEEY
jgi:hypothetical protein